MAFMKRFSLQIGLIYNLVILIANLNILDPIERASRDKQPLNSGWIDWLDWLFRSFNRLFHESSTMNHILLIPRKEKKSKNQKLDLNACITAYFSKKHFCSFWWENFLKNGRIWKFIECWQSLLKKVKKFETVYGFSF